MQGFSECGQGVLDMLWGGVFEYPSFDQPVTFHAPQGLGQDLLRDAGQPTAQFGVPLRSGEQRVDQQNPPLGGQSLQRLPGCAALLPGRRVSPVP